MNTKILDKKLNRSLGYNNILGVGILFAVLGAALVALVLAGVLKGDKDEETIRYIAFGTAGLAVLILTTAIAKRSKKKNYLGILNVNEAEFKEIIEDINNLKFNDTTLALGQKYVFFSGSAIRGQKKVLCIKYEEISSVEYTKSTEFTIGHGVFFWVKNVYITFYDHNNEWIATVGRGSYKRKLRKISKILINKGISENKNEIRY